MSFDEKSLALFIRVAKLGAIGKAGRELELSATAATQRIQALERDVGAQLLNRTTRRVKLTSDGDLFLAHALHLIGAFEDARAQLAGSTAHIKGNLRVTASASFGRRYIAPHMAEFLRTYPDMNVRLHLSDAIVDIVNDGFDLALRIGTLRSSTLIARKLAENPRILVAAPKYLKKHGRPKKPADLAHHNCIVLGENSTWTLREQDGHSRAVRVAGNFTTNYGEATTEAAIGGVGIALKSKWDIKEQLAERTLVPVLPKFVVDPLWSVWAVRPAAQTVPARVRAFSDFVQHKLKSIGS